MQCSFGKLSLVGGGHGGPTGMTQSGGLRDMEDSHSSPMVRKDLKESGYVGASKSGSPALKSPKHHFKMNTNVADYPLKARGQTALSIVHFCNIPCF